MATAFVGGAIVGSFLNVVGYRVPAGRSVIGGRSACPACGHPVRARDNLPILGWLMLGGRCRDCGSQIAADYPLVEAACGTALAALAAAEIIHWRSTGSTVAMVDRLIVLGDWRWLIVWLGKATTLLTIVAWSLLARADHAVRWRTVAAAVVIVWGMTVAGSTPRLWLGVIDGSVMAVLLAAARGMLGVPSGPGTEASATGGTGHGFRVAILASIALVGWTAAGSAGASGLVRWFRTLSPS